MKVATTAAAATTRHAEMPQTAKVGSGWETNLNYTLAEHAREEYMRLYTLLQRMEGLKISGIQEITLKAQTGTVTIPVDDASRIGLDLSEQLGERLTKLERDIFRYEKDSLENEPEEREGEGERCEALNFCLPMRPLSDEEFLTLPAEAQRAYDQTREVLRSRKAA